MHVESPADFDRRVVEGVEKALRNPALRPIRGVSFPSTDVLLQRLTPQRQLLVRIIRRKGPQSVYALAKMLGRDRKNVGQDLQELARWGLVKFARKRINGRRCVVPTVPYDTIDIQIHL